MNVVPTDMVLNDHSNHIECSKSPRIYVADVSLRSVISCMYVVGDIESVRVLLHKLITSNPIHCCNYLVPVVSVWPKTLRKNPNDRPDLIVTHSMVLVLEELLTKSLMELNTDNSNKV